MSQGSELQSQIDKDLKPAAADLERDHEAGKGRLLKVANDLAAAIEQHNAALIKEHLDTLNGLMPDYAALVTRTKTLLARAAKLDAGDERSAEHKAIVALTATLGDLQGRMDRNYLKLKNLQDKAHDELAKSKASGADFAEEWAEMEAFMDKNLKLAKTRLQQIRLLHELAQGAVQERDAAELVQIQRRNEERTTWKPTAEEVNKRLLEFFAKGEPKLSQDLRDQATRDRVKFDKTAREIAGLHKEIDGHYGDIKGLKIKPVDPKKAAVAMDIPAGNEAKVKKALEAASLERGLDALAKELKLKVSGADLLAKLRKARL